MLIKTPTRLQGPVSASACRVGAQPGTGLEAAFPEDCVLLTAHLPRPRGSGMGKGAGSWHRAHVSLLARLPRGFISAVADRSCRPMSDAFGHSHSQSTTSYQGGSCPTSSTLSYPLALPGLVCSTQGQDMQKSPCWCQAHQPGCPAQASCEGRTAVLQLTHRVHSLGWSGRNYHSDTV